MFKKKKVLELKIIALEVMAFFLLSILNHLQKVQYLKKKFLTTIAGVKVDTPSVT